MHPTQVRLDLEADDYVFKNMFRGPNIVIKIFHYLKHRWKCAVHALFKCVTMFQYLWLLTVLATTPFAARIGPDEISI